MLTEQLPEKSYERNLNHNYMIIKEEDPNTDYGYQVKMLTDNQINGLLPVSLRVENGIENFYYEIQSKQTFERIYERKSISYGELQIILKSFLKLEKNLMNYLLSYDNIIIDPSFLFMNMESKEVNFVYFPGYQQDARTGFVALVEYMLTKTDHADEKAVVLIYKLYRYTRNENFILSEVEQFLDTSSEIKLSKSLADQKIPKSTVLSGTGVAAPWSTELEKENERENKDYYGDSKNDNHARAYVSEESEEELSGEERVRRWKESTSIEAQDQLTKKKKEQNGISNKNLMICSIIISMFLLGILAAEKCLGIICLPPKIEMFVFAGIIVFAVLGIVFNLMAAAKEKTEKSNGMEKIHKKSSEFYAGIPLKEQKTRERKLEEKEEGKPIQFRQINNPKPFVMETQETYFTGEGETLCLEDQLEGHILRGCDGYSFEYKLDHFPVVIGRMKPYVDVAFEDQSVSKMHAKIEEHNGQIFLADMNSKNGTKKNGEYIGINESVPVMPGDEILFGKVKLRYCTS